MNYNLQSSDEFNRLIKFCSGLCFKDEESADSLETSESMEASYNFTAAMMQLGNYDITSMQAEFDSFINGDLAKKIAEINSITTDPNLSQISKDSLLIKLNWELSELSKIQTSMSSNLAITKAEINNIINNYEEKNAWYIEKAVNTLAREEMIASMCKDNSLKNADYNNSIIEEYSNTLKSFPILEINKFIKTSAGKALIKSPDPINRPAKFLPFFAKARLAGDFHIIDYPQGILNEFEITSFLEIYYKCLKYFIAVNLTGAFKGHPKYRAFVHLMVVTMSIDEYMTRSLADFSNIDLYDSKSLRNLFISHGLDYFDDMPLIYQRTIAKNLNNLLENKGTSKVIADILSIFGFSNIEISKYYLSKEYSIDPVSNEMAWEDPGLSFLKVPEEKMDLQLTLKDAEKIPYDTIVNKDLRYWKSGIKDEILKKNFSLITTKYLSVDAAIDALKTGLDFGFLMSILQKNIKENSSLNDLLVYVDTLISPKKIRLVDSVIALQILVLRVMGVESVPIISLSSMANVYGFNFEGLANLIQNDPDLLALYNEVCNTAGLSGLIYKSNSTDSFKMITEAFASNQKLRKVIESEVKKTNDPERWKDLLNLWKCIYTSNFNIQWITNNIVSGTTNVFSGYNQHLLAVDPDLYDYINRFEEGGSVEETDPIRLSTLRNTAILEICRGISMVLDDANFSFTSSVGSIVLDMIKDYVYRLINIFKAYTTDILEISVFYVYDFSTFNTVRLFDQGTNINESEVLSADGLIGLNDDNNSPSIITTNTFDNLDTQDSFIITINEV
jgi:hypothetical protein